MTARLSVFLLILSRTGRRGQCLLRFKFSLCSMSGRRETCGRKAVLIMPNVVMGKKKERRRGKCVEHWFRVPRCFGGAKSSKARITNGKKGNASWLI